MNGREEIEVSSILEKQRLEEVTTVTEQIGDDQRHNDRRQHRGEKLEIGKDDASGPEGVIYDREDDEILNEFGLSRHARQSNSDGDLTTLIITGYSVSSNIQDLEDACFAEDLEMDFHEDEDELYTAALSIKSGDQMETIPPANIG